MLKLPQHPLNLSVESGHDAISTTNPYNTTLFCEQILLSKLGVSKSMHDDFFQQLFMNLALETGHSLASIFLRVDFEF